MEVFDLVKPDFKTLQGFEIASKNKGFVNILYLLTLSSMGAFLLLTRMHERYFYLPYVLLAAHQEAKYTEFGLKLLGN